ncbi:MAG TPA: hypothetical protein VJT82_02255 [Pyrinomonadaceae bacterium]|nr:hypothetical protein [Pyrinomonadaceae bacterium]
MRRLAIAISLTLVACAAHVRGQQQQPQPSTQTQTATQTPQPPQPKPLPDRWRDFVLDRTTPDDALRLLGKPAWDKTDQLQVHNIDRWISLRRKEKIFRKMTWKRLAGAHKLDLAFLDDRLVMLRVYYEGRQLPAENLSPTFGINFIAVEEVSPNSLEYEQNAVSHIEEYPVQYYAVAVSPNSFLSATVVDPGLKRMLKRVVNARVEGYLPGQVTELEMLSRKLEKF